MSGRAVRLVIGLTLVVAVGFGFTLRAQRRGGRGRNRVPETSQMLHSLKRLKCTFPMKAGDPVVSVDKIDLEEGTAEVVGFFQRDEDITVKLVGANLHFFSVAIDGGLTIVTVFAKETHDGRLQAVYSRAAYPDAVQFTGDCEPTR
jgi:hypothetical protein